MGSKIITLILFLTGTGFLLRTIFLVWNHTLPDFSVYYASVQTALAGGNPYIYTAAGMNFLYPVPALLLFYPFSFLSLQHASNAWIILSVCLLVISLIFLQKRKKSSYFLMSILFVGIVISFPFKFTLGMGQINMLVLSTLILFIYYYEKKKIPVSAGYLTIAILAKVSPLFILISLFLHKKWRSTLYTVGFLFLVSIACLIIFSPSITTYFFTNIIALIKNSPGSVYYNQSITGMLARLSVPIGMIGAIQVMLAVVSLLCVWKRPLSLLSFSFLITTMLLVSTITWQHHLVLLFIPFYYFISQKQSISLYVIVLFSYFLVSGNIQDPTRYAQAWYTGILLSHGTIGIGILWSLQVAQLWKQKRIYEK